MGGTKAKAQGRGQDEEEDGQAVAVGLDEAGEEGVLGKGRDEEPGEPGLAGEVKAGQAPGPAILLDPLDPAIGPSCGGRDQGGRGLGLPAPDQALLGERNGGGD